MQLTGTVSAVDHLMTNAGGHEMTVLQLQVHEDLKEFGGYSGSAVRADSVVVGLLVEQVQERMIAQGQRRRAANVLYAVPIAKIIARFRLGATVSRHREAASPQRLVDTAYFDLDGLKTAILDVVAGREDRVLAFGLADVDMKVVTNLTQWLPTYIGEVAPKGQLALRPEVLSVNAVAKYVLRYVDDLDRLNVVCPVLVDGVDTALVAELWEQVRAACGGARQRLILFLVGEPDGGFPDKVDVLPAPAVRREDIADWTRHVVTARRWPTSLAAPWTSEIVKQAAVDPEGDGPLDLRLTYEILENCIERVRLRHHELRDHLEELESRC